MRWVVWHVARGYLVDTCAGGAWSANLDDAIWYDTSDEARAALRFAEIDPDPDIRILPL